MISPLHETAYVSKKSPYADSYRVNQTWKEIVSPTRKQFIEEAEYKNRKDEQYFCDRLYLSFEGEKVEHSAFFMKPTKLDFAATVTLYAKETGCYPFLFATCGSVKIYVNGEQQDRMFTYERNQEKSKELRLHLMEGENLLYIQCNELGERDSQVYFKICYIGEAPLMGSLPVKIDLEQLEKTRRILADLYLDKFNFNEPDIKLHLKEKSSVKLDLEVALCFKDAHIPSKTVRKQVQLQPGDSIIQIGDLIYQKTGLVNVTVTAYLYELPVSRSLQFEYYEERIMGGVWDEDICIRKRKVLSFLAAHGTPNFQKALAIYEADGDSKEANRIVDQELVCINQRYDCSDFRLPAFFYALKSYKVPEEIKEKLRDTLLSFRYWFDEPGNDVMWFFSENHALCFHTCELLAGELFPEDTFTNSDMTGEEHRIKAKNLLLKWFKDFMIQGFTEWNSAVYIPIDVISMVTLFDCSKDSEIRNAAKLALDKTFTILAKNSYRGIVSASYGRIYFKNLIGRRTNEASALNFIVSGEGWLNQHTFSTVLLALSQYVPGEGILSYYQGKEEGSLYEELQGEEKVHLYSYKTPDYVLSSVIDYRPGEAGLQEHVMQLMIKDCDTQIWINHPGEAVYFGEGRPSYFAGNGTLPKVTQNKNMVELTYDLLDQEVDYTHAYCPLSYFDEWTLAWDRLYLRKDDICVTLYAKNGLTITDSGPLRRCEVISPGKHNVWSIIVEKLQT